MSLITKCNECSFTHGKERFHLELSAISHPDSYKSLSKKILAEAKKYDLALLCTNIPYDNNYFFEFKGNIGIISFSDWNGITDLPVANGLVYFIISMMCDEFGIGETHEDNIGCVNDFWWDKNGVDVGMRAAFICKDCRDSYKGDSDILQDINNLLNLLSHASRVGKDISEVASPVSVSDDVFDVFMCHNTDDKPFIRKMNEVFKAAEIRTWLDEEQVELGEIWQVELEKQIENIQAVCVFVGENGIGPWEEFEVRAFLSKFVRRDCRIIPVILPSTKEIPKLPIFLEQIQYCDLRKDYELKIQKLIKVLKKK